MSQTNSTPSIRHTQPYTFTAQPPQPAMAARATVASSHNTPSKTTPLDETHTAKKGAALNKTAVFTISALVVVKLLADLQGWWLLPILETFLKREMMDFYQKASGMIVPFLTALAVGAMFLFNKSRSWLVAAALYAISAVAGVLPLLGETTPTVSMLGSACWLGANISLVAALFLNINDGHRVIGKTAAVALIVTTGTTLILAALFYINSITTGLSLYAEPQVTQFSVVLIHNIWTAVQTVTAVLIGAFLLTVVRKTQKTGKAHETHTSHGNAQELGESKQKSSLLSICGGAGALLAAVGVAIQAQTLVSNVGLNFDWNLYGGINEPIRKLVLFGQIPALLGFLLFGFGYWAHSRKNGGVQGYAAALTVWAQVLLVGGLLFSQGPTAMIHRMSAGWVSIAILATTGLAALAGALSFLSTRKTAKAASAEASDMSTDRDASSKLALTTAILLVSSVAAGAFVAFGLNSVTSALLGTEDLSLKLKMMAKPLLFVGCFALILAGLHHLANTKKTSETTTAL